MTHTALPWVADAYGNKHDAFIRPLPDRYGNAPAVATISKTLYPASWKDNLRLAVRGANNHDSLLAALEELRDATKNFGTDVSMAGLPRTARDSFTTVTGKLQNANKAIEDAKAWLLPPAQPSLWARPRSLGFGVGLAV